MKIKTFAILGVLLAGAGCSSIVAPVAGEGFEKMSGAEIQSALIGNSLDGVDSDGEYVIHYPEAGQMRIAYLGDTDTGVWRVDGDRYCRRWTKFGKGRERCVAFYRKGDQINWVRKGKVTDRSVLVPGNPANL